MTKMMIGAKIAVLALGIAGAVVSVWADDDDIVLPGQEGKTTGGKAEQVASAAKYMTPDYLKIPYLSIYYVEPTRMTDENVTIDYFVTDWDNRKVRFDDDSERFDVTLRYSTDCTNWRTREAKGVKSGDGRFDLGKLPEGLYTFSLQSVDKRGVKSRVCWHEFRVMDRAKATIKASEICRVAANDLKGYGIATEPEDFYDIRMVDVGTLNPPVNHFDRHGCKKNKAEFAAFEKSMHDLIAAAAASEEGRAALAAHPEGYVVFAPAKGGEFIFRTRDYRKVVCGAKFDAAKVEARAVATSKGLTRLFAEKAAAGVRKLVLPKGVYRLSLAETVEIPAGLTVDLNGSKLKLNLSKLQKGAPVAMTGVTDAHLVNGAFEGNYFEYDYEGCGTYNPEHVNFFSMLGECRWCSVEDVRISYTVGSGTTYNGMGLVNGGYSRIHKAPGKWEKGSLTESGELDASAAGRWTTPFIELGNMCSNKYMTVSRYLSYQGISTRSSYQAIAFYDADRRPLRSETAAQYCRVLVPAGAKFYRVSLEVDESETGKKTDQRGYFLKMIRDCAFKRISYRWCRTNGLSCMDGFNLLFEDIDISRSGDESCRCASDTEDGWDGSQNFTYRRITCHDNPHGDFTVCCGHDFTYEDCNMRIWAMRRVGGACYRNCTIKGGEFECRYRSRLHAVRFENCRFTGSVQIGSSKKDDKKIDQADWEIVLNGAEIVGADPAKPISVTAGTTGRIRNCTIRNAVLKGEKAHFENCKTENVKEEWK